ncbi:MAG: FecR family protein [Bacteriovoracaceae bacterium]
MEKRLLIGCVLMAFSFSAFAGKKVAVVKMLRGEVNVLTLGKTSKLNVNDQVEDGSVIKTGEKSFAKIVFTDQSQMNIGPVSEMKIEKFSGDDSGVIDLVKGKIRSQVTKDYLQMKDKDKSKLFIKTPNAVMGVRGTDFMISTNGQNTATVLFEGEIVFNKLDNKQGLTSDRLEAIVDAGVRMQPGEFSVVERARPEPTIPSVLNVQQLEVLEKNQNFESDRAPQAAVEEVPQTSVVPGGLSGQAVSNNPDALKQEIAQVGAATDGAKSASTSNAEGYVQGDKVKPANGSFVHVESGIIIPPGPGAVLDKNTNTYIPNPEMGKVGNDGSYLPPKNVEITNDGKILVMARDASGAQVIKEVSAPSPVIVASNTVTLGKTPEIISSSPELLKPRGPISNVIFNPDFAPNGLNDQRNTLINSTSGAASPTEAAQQQASDRVRATININNPTGATPP